MKFTWRSNKHESTSQERVVKIAVLSDLHLETPATRPTYSEYTFSSSARYLALLGDIGLVRDEALFTFLDKEVQNFEKVFYVLGNHEPYDCTYAAAKVALQAFAEKSSGRFVLLDQTRYDLTPNLTILGCTLFSAIHPSQTSSVQLFVSDFERIQGWDVEQHNAAHSADLAWLNQQVTDISQHEPQREVAIFTHYCPTMQPEAHDPRHLSDESNVRSAFVTDLSAEPCWTSQSVALWAFGHTHHNCDFIDTATARRVVANQKGYRRSEALDFDAEKVVEIVPRDSKGHGSKQSKSIFEALRIRGHRLQS